MLETAAWISGSGPRLAAPRRPPLRPGGGVALVPVALVAAGAATWAVAAGAGAAVGESWAKRAVAEATAKVSKLAIENGDGFTRRMVETRRQSGKPMFMEEEENSRSWSQIPDAKAWGNPVAPP